MFARDASGARQRIRHAAFPAHKTLEDIDFTAQPGAERRLILHLAQHAWITEHSNVSFFGPPGTDKTHLAIALAIKACQHGHRVAFATAQQWVDRLDAAQHRTALDDELRRLERYSSGSAFRRRSSIRVTGRATSTPCGGLTRATQVRWESSSLGAVLDNLYKFVVPAVAGPARLVTLRALATPDLSATALRVAAGAWT